MRSGIDLKHLRYLLAVADEGTFTGGAHALGMTQPALSRAIKALEKAVATPLFVRHQHGLDLTEAGLLLTHEARTLLDTVDAALTRVRRYGKEGPQLRITARGYDVDVLQELVTSYNQRFPRELPARGVMADCGDQTEQVRTGKADVALLRAPFDSRGLDSDLIRTDPRIAVLPEGHPLAGRESVQRRELAGETFPLPADLTPAQRAHWLGIDLADHDWHPGPPVHDATQLIGSIRLGDGIGFIPAPHVSAVPAAGISVVRVENLSPSELRIVWAASTISPEVARFVRHTAERVVADVAV